MNIFQEAGVPSEKEKAEKAAQSANVFLDYYSENKIYLNDKLEDKIDSMNGRLRESWITFRYAKWDGQNNIEEWKKAWDIAKEELPIINKEIKKEFRKILGIN